MSWCSCWGSLGGWQAGGIREKKFFLIFSTECSAEQARNFSRKYLISYISFRQAEEK